MRLALPFLLLVAVVVAAYTPEPIKAAPGLAVEADTTWTWPEQAENLQVLPADTPPERLREVMRGMSASLGVECGYCHVGEGEDFLTWDFAADENESKAIARDMMEMVWQINTATLPAMDGLAETEEWRVTCWTCHRGATTPDK